MNRSDFAFELADRCPPDAAAVCIWRRRFEGFGGTLPFARMATGFCKASSVAFAGLVFLVGSACGGSNDAPSSQTVGGSGFSGTGMSAAGMAGNGGSPSAAASATAAGGGAGGAAAGAATSGGSAGGSAGQGAGGSGGAAGGMMGGAGGTGGSGG